MKGNEKTKKVISIIAMLYGLKNYFLKNGNDFPISMKLREMMYHEFRNGLISSDELSEDFKKEMRKSYKERPEPIYFSPDEFSDLLQIKFQKEKEIHPGLSLSVFAKNEARRLKKKLNNVARLKGDPEHYSRDNGWYLTQQFIEYLKNQEYKFKNSKSLGFDLDKKTIEQKWQEFVKFGIIPDTTDYDYFAYAISGKAIPAEKQPYRPIELIGNKVGLYQLLYSIQCEYDPPRTNKLKVLTNHRKKVASELFINKHGKSIGKLSNL